MTELVLPMLDRLRQVALLRYILASVGALAVDVSSFRVLLALGLAPMLAAALGYGVGIVAHWLLSSRAVFADQVAAAGLARTRQKAMFVASALVGLALTTGIVGAASAAGLDPLAAKVVAVVISFATTWLLRKRVVFR